jgi:hypothetical protein
MPILIGITAVSVRNSIFFIPMFVVRLWFTRRTVTLPVLLLDLLVTVLSVGALPQSFGMDLLRHYVIGTRTMLILPNESAILLCQVVLYGLLTQLTARH